MGELQGAVSLTKSDIENGLKRLPALSSTVTQLLELTQREDVDPGQVSQTVAQDPVLSARLLRVANSPFFGLAGEIVSLNQACMILGMGTVRNLAVSVGMKNSLGSDKQSQEQAALWRRATEKAVAAEALARHCRLSSETAFTAGMLDDLGEMVVISCFPDASEAVKQHIIDQGCDQSAAENAVFGMNHREVGAMLAKLWCLPKLIQQVIAGRAGGGADVPPVIDIVALADAIVDLDRDSAVDELMQQLPADAASRRGVDSQLLEKWLVDIEKGQALVEILT